MGRSGLVFFLLFLLATSSWNCSVARRVEVAPGIVYKALNCTGEGESWKVGPTLIHVVWSNTSSRLVRPITADPNKKLETLPEMLPPTALVGINGGYFW